MVQVMIRVPLLSYLYCLNITTLAYVNAHPFGCRGRIGWKSAMDPDLAREMEEKWDGYIDLLVKNHVYIKDSFLNLLVWSKNPHMGDFTSKLVIRGG